MTTWEKGLLLFCERKNSPTFFREKKPLMGFYAGVSHIIIIRIFMMRTPMMYSMNFMFYGRLQHLLGQTHLQGLLVYNTQYGTLKLYIQCSTPDLVNSSSLIPVGQSNLPFLHHVGSQFDDLSWGKEEITKSL